MSKRTLLVIGATGDVGQGVVRAALADGWGVVAAGRSLARLTATFASVADMRLLPCEGTLESEESAAALWDAALALTGSIEAVVVSVNAATRLAPLAEWTGSELADLLAANLLTHFNAAKVMLPRLPETGLYIGIGGGTADFIIPTNATASIAQAGLRMMYRGFAREKKSGAALRELMIVSMVNGVSKRERALPDWVTDDDVGRHICAILAAPDRFPGPILQLKTRDQAGQPDVAE